MCTIAGAYLFHWLAFQFEAAAQVSTARPAKLATEHNWSATPSDDLAQVGNKIVHMQSCPAGVNGRESEYWVLIDGPESKRAYRCGTGQGHGRDVRRGRAARHASVRYGKSACRRLHNSQRFQWVAEGYYRGPFCSTNAPGTSRSGNVSVPPGEYKAFARVSNRASNTTVDFSGSIIECWMDDVCIYAETRRVPSSFRTSR